MESPYIYKFKNKKKKDIINKDNILDQREFSFPEYNIIIGLMDNNTLYIKCEYKQVLYQKVLSFEELQNLHEKIKKFNNIKEIYSIFIDIIRDNKIFVVQFNLNQIKFNLLLKPKKNKIQPIEIPLLRIDQENSKEIFDKKNNDTIYNDNDFIIMQNNTFDDNVDSVILGFVNNMNGQMQANKIKTEENNNINNIKTKAKAKKKCKTLSTDIDNEKINFYEVSEINYNNGHKHNEKDVDIYKLYNIINDLRNELFQIKIKQKEIINDKEIKEIIKTNKRLINEINEIQSKLYMLNEENVKNKEEIANLKNIINNKNRENDINTYKKDIQNIIEENEEYLHNKSFDKNFPKFNKNRNKTIKKSRTNRNKSRGRSTPHYYKNDEANNNNIKMESYIFKQKYKIKGDETEIDLTNEKIGDSGLEVLSTIELEDVKNFSLDDNAIYDITPLRNMKLSQLLVLNLDNNQISDLSVLEQVKFYQLQKLWLNNNNITDISVFENVKFSSLQGLWLNNNSIEDITVFEKVKLNNLQKIYINYNQIKNIDCLERIKMKNLQLLSFTNNRIDYNIPKNKNIIINIKEKLSYLFY